MLDDISPRHHGPASLKTIGERVRQARVARGWSQQYLAQAAGFKSQGGVANLENRASTRGGFNLPTIASVRG